MKETVIQFGEGVFLRGFAEDFLHKMNEQGTYDGKAVIVQPRNSNKVEALNKQNCEYTLILRGVHKGKEVNDFIEVKSVSRAVDPYKDFSSFLSLAHNKDFRIIVSNTTEAGIVFDESCSFSDRPCSSFPGKLTQLLYERYVSGLGGFIILPCELIDNNGEELKKCVLAYCKLWELSNDFALWIENENHFCNTLVDRIVSGFSAPDEKELFKKTGKRDLFLNTAEPFHLWVIEGNFENEFPLKKSLINAVWTDDVSVYKKRKVRLLNGAHTSIVCLGLLMGLETVKDCTDNSLMNDFLNKCLMEEILPSLGESEEEKAFAQSVTERFSNPFIRHLLSAISMNSISKWGVRVLPSIIEYKDKFGELPCCLVLSLSALIYYYKNFKPNDDITAIDKIKNGSLEEILKDTSLWGADISFMLAKVTEYYNKIENHSVEETIKCVL